MPQDSKSNKQNPGSNRPEKVSLIIVVNGAPATIEMESKAPLKAAAERALAETHNAGRPLGDWEMKLNDRTLDMNLKIEDFGLKSNQELFLSLKAGVGGNITNKYAHGSFQQ
jgi:hypothetical protein